MSFYKKPKRFSLYKEFDFTGFYEIEELNKTLLYIIKELLFGKELSSFSLSVSWPVEVLSDSEQLDYLRRTVQRGLANAITSEINTPIDFANAEAELLVDFRTKRVFLRLSPVFIKGNYCKLSRTISQTEYFCPVCKGRGKILPKKRRLSVEEFNARPNCTRCAGSGRLAPESIGKLIEPFFKNAFKSKGIIFHGAGREDTDVLMLGRGRPFIVEILQPENRVVDLVELENKINSFLENKVSLNSLEFSNSKEIQVIKEYPHDKIYSAIIECESKPDVTKLSKLFGTQLEVEQRTPTRVSKRRSDLVRSKKVVLLEVNELTGFEFVLKLKTSYGTYVKEFISGDGDRTIPSISSLLGIECKCKQLDVLEIL